uniref:Uncharacterized protein n=1 Tax=Tanacetum cinerariifolium TaxID=118510 RepID=A0A699JTD9_TANCI|nr:hypothetical protein [Tanacetum cinerariifolium]
MLMAEDNVGNQFRPNAVQDVRNQVIQNVVQNPGVQYVRNYNGLRVDTRISNQYGIGNVVIARAEANVKLRKRDGAYLLKQMQIAQKEEVGIQLTSEEFEFIDDVEEQYTKLLEPNLEPHQVQQNDSIVISVVSSMEQGGRTVKQHSATVKETRAYHESLFHNLATEVEKINLVNRKMKETNAKLTIELARYKNQEKCFEISQENYDKLKRCYQKSIYQEQCLTKKINALHLSFGKQIMTLNEEISNLNKQLLKKKSTGSSLQEEKKRLKSDFKIREDELLDKQIQLENKIKKLDNILVKMG